MQIEKFYTKDKEFYAHKSDKQTRRETLKEHTDLCCDYFQKIFPKENYESFWNHIKEFCKWDSVSTESQELICEMYYHVPLFHDLGKTNPIFQNENMDNPIVSTDRSKDFALLSSKHSLFSAVLYINTFAKKIKETISIKEEQSICIFFMFCNAYVISRHHSDLSEFETFIGSFYEGYDAFEIVRILEKGVFKEILCEEIFLHIHGEWVEGQEFVFLDKLKKFRKKKITKEIAPVFYAYVKLLYSVLIAADYYATTEFCNGIKTEICSDKKEIEHMREIYQNSELIQGIRKYEREQYGNPEKVLNDMNMLRNELFLDAEKNLLNHKEKNIYYLEAPTGSGKSNTAIQLSFLLQEINQAEKLFYVYPYNTLVEQNFDTLKTIFGYHDELMDNIVVINSITPIKMKNNNRGTQTVKEDDNEQIYEKALLNRQFLNYPVILTTSVSFFEYLFSEKQESLMGFHKFQNSVIILDEIQCYKNNIWTEMITFFDTFAKILNMKIIIMSATLPDLNQLIQEKNKTVKLIDNRKKYYENPIFSKRVQIYYDLMKEKITLEFLFQHMKRYEGSNKKILLEFIHKKSADEFYEMLMKKKEIGELSWAEIEIMTGDDNQMERNRIDSF